LVEAARTAQLVAAVEVSEVIDELDVVEEGFEEAERLLWALESAAMLEGAESVEVPQAVETPEMVEVLRLIQVLYLFEMLEVVGLVERTEKLSEHGMAVVVAVAAARLVLVEV
jgi:hypothetical protein